MNELRQYQGQAKTMVYDAWRVFKRVMLLLVTGGGKTVIFVDIIRDVLKKNKRVMLIAHREELIMQAHKTLYRNKIFTGIIKAGNRPQFSLNCQVGSIQTLSRRKALPKADVVIIDEGHHYQEDNSYGKLIEGHYSDALVLLVTATSYRLSGAGFKGIDKLIISKTYDDLKIDGYLTPYRYFVGDGPDLDKIKLSKGDYIEKEASKVMKLVPLVKTYEEHCRGMCGIVFCASVEHSIQVAEDYNRAGYIAAHLDGETPAVERAEIVKKFRAREIAVICNYGIVTEGADFPDMEFIQLARPTKSLSLVFQMWGRPMRVNQAVIQGLDTAEQRRQAIAAGPKPYAYILDNAGCYIDHGLPDQKIDWQRHFDGVDKKKENKEGDWIEMIEYVADTPEGIRIKTKNIHEVEGLRMVEINKTIKKTLFNITSIKQFDEYYQLAFKIRTVKKKGWFALYKFCEFCEKNHIMINDESWQYIFNKLNKEPKEKMALAEDYRKTVTDSINQCYAESQRSELLSGLDHQIKKRKRTPQKIYIPSGALRKHRYQFEQKMKSIMDRKAQLQRENGQ